MKSPDKSYWITPVTLTTTGEVTGGFLVLCSSSLPKLFRSTPSLKKAVSEVQLWISLSHANSKASSKTSSKTSSKLGLSSWIRVQGEGREKRAEHSHFTEIDDDYIKELGTISSINDGSVRVDAERGLPQIVCTTEIITTHEFQLVKE